MITNRNHAVIHTLALCKELEIIQSITSLAGNPPLLSKPRTIHECAETAEDLQRHIQSAEQAASTPELGDRLYGETVALLASLKRHAREIVRCSGAGVWSRNAAGAVVPTDEALLEQFADLRDKCYYPIMDVLQRVSAIADAIPLPADAMTPDRATQLFDVSRETLRQAVQDGELDSYRDAREPKGAPRRFSGAQLALLYDRRT